MDRDMMLAHFLLHNWEPMLMRDVGVVLWNPDLNTLMRICIVCKKMYCSEEQWLSNTPDFVIHSHWDAVPDAHLQLYFARSTDEAFNPVAGVRL